MNSIQKFEEKITGALEILYRMERDKEIPCKGQITYWNEKLKNINLMVKYFESFEK